jgi:type IV pilus assembly protein PilC
MGVFRFKILKDDGKISKGTMELPFDEMTAAIRYLERQGGMVLSVEPLDRVSSFLHKIPQYFGKVKRPELAEVLNNLSMLLKAGVPVWTGIRDISVDIKNPLLARTLKFICTDIESGQTFSQAIARHEKVFSSLVISMCRIGEETGRLDEMLKKSADHLTHLDEIIGGTKRAMMYPAFLMVVVLGACGFWFLVVVPQLVSLFQDMGVELPFLTRLLLTISELFQNYFFTAIGVSAIAIIVLLTLRKRSAKVRLAMDVAILRIPVISMIIETSLVARICEYLGIMLSAGVGVMRTLEIITGTMENEVYKRRLKEVEENIKMGNNISSSMRKAKALHPFAIRMISIGEESGKIEEQTEYVAEVYRKKLSALVEVLGKTLEPVMLVFLGIIFALVIGGLLLPIYDLISSVGGV